MMKAIRASLVWLPALLLGVPISGCGTDKSQPHQEAAAVSSPPKPVVSPRQLFEAFQKLKVGMSREEIDAIVGIPGKPVPNRYDLRSGSDCGIIIKDGVVTGSWRMSQDEESIERMKKVTLGMSEAQVNEAIGADTLNRCEVYHWGEHEPPFEVSFFEGTALRVSMPQEPSLRE